MLGDAISGEFDLILCWKSDRLSRGIYPAAALMEVVESTGIRLESVVDNIDEKTFGLHAAIGKIEIDGFRERAMLGKRGAAKAGRWPVGELAYGYTRDDHGRPVIDPREGWYVKEIFRRYIEDGLSAQKIATWLMEENAPRRRGSQWGVWYPQQVLTMLSHPAYSGESVYGRKRYRRTESGQRVTDVSAEDWITVPFPPLVSDELWGQAQKTKASRSTSTKRNTKTVHLLQGLLVCDECGFRFSVITQRGNTIRTRNGVRRNTYKNPLRYYKCGGMLRHGMKCREHSHLRADALEQRIWEEVVRIVRSPELIVNGLMPGVEAPDANHLERELKEAQTHLARVEQEEDRLIRLLVSGKIIEKQFDRQRKFIVERLDASRQSVDAIRGRLRALEEAGEVGEAIKAWAAQLEQGLNALTLEERQQVLRLVINRARIGRNGDVTLVLAIPVAEFIPLEKRDS